MTTDDLEMILSALEEPDSGLVSGYGRTTGSPGIRCADFAAAIRALRAKADALDALGAWIGSDCQREAEIGADTGVLDWIDGISPGEPRVILTNADGDTVAGCTRPDLASAITAALERAR